MTTSTDETSSIGGRESLKDGGSHHHPTKKTSTFKKLFKGIRKNAVAAPPSHYDHVEIEEEGEEVSLSPPKQPQPQQQPPPEKIIRMDKYGFLLTDDDDNNESPHHAHPTHHTPQILHAELRLHKWQEMLDRVPKSKTHTVSFSNTQSKVKYYTRRGLPDGVRSRAWTVLTGVDVIMAERGGEYEGLVRRAEEEFERWRVGVEGQAPREDEKEEDDVRRRVSEVSALGDASVSSVVLETIERDIHRTFPRHYLFHNGLEDEEEEELRKRNGGGVEGGGAGGSCVEDSEDVDYSDEDDDDHDYDHDGGLSVDQMTDENKLEKKKLFNDMIGQSLSFSGCGALHNVDTNMASLKLEEGTTNGKAEKSLKSSITEGSIVSGHSTSIEAGLGQAALRRILRAYSVYDRQVGYCQGMNFIAAMFLTFLSEEEAFWLLVVVMNEEPYKLRELFGEDMAGTHEVLYIAEKLMHQFLPKLSQHMEAENIHISMFVTPWLLTVYTSTFPFELVSKVWDCFLVEGWKVVYRVMLALMEAGSREIMSLHFEQILNFFRDFPQTVDGSKIMHASLKIPLKRKHIQKHVTEWRRSNAAGDELSRQSTARGAPVGLLRRRNSDDSSVSGTVKSHGEKSQGSKTSSRGAFGKRGARDIIIEDLSGQLLPIIGASKFAIMLHNVLSPEECSEIIEIAENSGFQPAAIYDASTKVVHRNCTRHFIDDHAIAENWFERILHALSDTPYEQKVKSCPWIGTRQNADPVHAVSLNERLRVIKYTEGQFFTKHQDASFTRGRDAGDRAGEKSLMSVHIYLNEKFKGGVTRFHGGGRWFDIHSKTGSVLLFEPSIMHEAVKVTKGAKYLVRSDIMYSSKMDFSQVAGTGFTQQL
ncbi:hypothetical protein HJC23_008681 [Cyclotella cryptica]|uniref:Rab-GAP TBC domain-containing protein n=1 Tax=Cyclotella cryptica TaxID=29204 RepID=A0ABD3QGL3_9STRA|eukprot:CCRYP_005398-RA/>CCRYP_005398-RA protein AED:0.18 eAED:-0.04 QI:0/-1/0/1/-1/1/1/0/871